MSLRSILLLAQQAFPDLDPDAGAGAGAAGAAFGGVILIIELALVVLTLAGVWKCFSKAGKPGWAAIVPIYNFVVGLQIVGKPIWWIILLFIPCVNFIVLLLLAIEFAKAYGQGAGFGIGLWLLPFVFFPILGFGDARYLGPTGAVTPRM